MRSAAPRVLSGRYELLEPLGAGGMATVYRGTDRVLGRTVAVKVLGPSLSADPSFVSRFRREARAAAGLNHPAVVQVFDTGSDDGTHYIVMEHVPGRTLAEILRTEGTLQPERAAEIAEAVADALSVAHDHGIVHRDVKPANIMITPVGEVRVMDFGIARALTSEDTLTKTAIVLGTVTYLSPEQAHGQPVDARSDLYSLGVVLYEMLTGRPPFTGDSAIAVAAKHVGEEPIPPSRVDRGVPRALELITLKALAKDPKDRYRSAQEMRDELERWRADDHLAATDPFDPTKTAVLQPIPAPSRRRWWIAAAVAGLALLLAAVVAASLLGNHSLAPPRHPAAHPSATVPSTPASPSPVKTLTFAREVQTLQAMLAEGERSGAVDKHAADDLSHRLDDITKSVAEGKTEDIGNKLSDMHDKLMESVDKGQIDRSFASRFDHGINLLASTLGVSVEND